MSAAPRDKYGALVGDGGTTHYPTYDMNGGGMAWGGNSIMSAQSRRLGRTSKRFELNGVSLAEKLAEIGTSVAWLPGRYGMQQWENRTLDGAINRARAGRADERDWNKLSLSLRCECCAAKPDKRCRRTDVPPPNRPGAKWKPPRMDVVHDARRALAILAYGE